MNEANEALTAAAEVFRELDQQVWPQSERDEFHGEAGRCPVDYAEAQALVDRALHALSERPAEPLGNLRSILESLTKAAEIEARNLFRSPPSAEEAARVRLRDDTTAAVMSAIKRICSSL